MQLRNGLQGPRIGIVFCPWCGQRLPDSQRDRWFEEVESRGIDPWEDEVPAEFQDDRWLTSPQEKRGARQHLDRLSIHGLAIADYKKELGLRTETSEGGSA
ncbi:DUF6980 family protein [Streptomyces sp. NBC_01589]|uniref:DUF6980 family protein n=1 Tax=unclassified Streptomyces TaxID=2593676 RepID=UPI0038695E2A